MGEKLKKKKRDEREEEGGRKRMSHKKVSEKWTEEGDQWREEEKGWQRIKWTGNNWERMRGEGRGTCCCVGAERSLQDLQFKVTLLFRAELHSSRPLWLSENNGNLSCESYLISAGSFVQMKGKLEQHEGSNLDGGYKARPISPWHRSSSSGFVEYSGLKWSQSQKCNLLHRLQWWKQRKKTQSE